MKRLQRKCFLVSAGLHLLLPLILVFGSALAPKTKTDDSPILNFLPIDTTDKNMSGGGDPNARSAPAELNKLVAPLPKPPAPAPQPQKPVEKPQEPEPTKESVTTKTDPESYEVRKDTKKRLPNVPTQIQARTPPKSTSQIAKNTTDDSSERQANERRNQLLKEIGSAANDLRENRSGTTAVKLYGPGGGGVPYANFLQTIKTIYTKAWVVPEGVEDDEATTEASVTIARDGRVVRASITRKSGNQAVDHSVQTTLDRVRVAAPLPSTASEDERTVTIGFNVKAKRGIG